MPIRRNEPSTSTVTGGTRRQAGGATKLPAAELKKLLADIDAAPPEQRAALFEGLASRGLELSEAQAKTLNEAATKYGVAVSFGQPAVPAPVEQAGGKGVVSTSLAEAGVTVTQAQRDEIAKQTALKAIDVVTKFKDVKGEAEAINGEGDPRVSARRSAMSLLIAEKSKQFVDLEQVKGLGGRVADDIAWLMDAERKDYTQQGANQFSWNRAEGYGASSYIQTEFSTRVKRAETKASSFETGQSKIVDAGDNSVLAAVNIKDPEKRAAALADILLQFRGRVDTAGTKIDYQNNRIDRVGTVLVAEQRMLAAAADLDANDPSKMRELALVSSVIASHPTSSVNSIFDARNTVAEMARLYPSFVKSGDESPYEAIHHNFSRDTPRHIGNFLATSMFPVGDEKLRAESFCALVGAMEAARNGDVATARAEVEKVLKKNPGIEGFGELASVDNAQLADKLRDLIAGKCKEPLSKEVEQFLSLSAHLYRVVVDSRPSMETLQRDLFRAGDAWGEVADVIAQMSKGNTLGTLRDLGEARLAMRDAIIGAKTGYERIELIKLDAQLNRLTNEELGGAVDRIGNVKTDAQRAECLLAVQTGLRSAIAMGLEHIVDPKDPAAGKGEPLGALLAEVDKAIGGGKIGEDQYRELMSRVYVAGAVVTQNTRSFFDSRTPALAAANIKLDPQFMDQLAKESPLHYVTALAQKGMTVGLQEKISARSIENVEGMRVLNGVGPVVFTSVVFAESAKELAKLGTSKDQLAVLYKLEEKKMVAVGGLFVDSAHAPGGNSHLNMYAMNNGIPVAALPDLRTKYAEFFQNAGKEGGVYIDDTGGNFRMMTLDKAVEDGLIPGAKKGDPASIEAAIEKLRPGVNRSVSYLKPTSEGQAFELAAKHEAIINEKRKTRQVELFIPMEEVGGLSRSPMWSELAKLGIHARHLAGEKGTVLALLSEHPVLGKHCLKGSQFTPADIRDALVEAVDPTSGRKLVDMWDRLWSQDPKIGSVNAEGTKETNPNHYLNSAFYTDRAYRSAVCEQLQHATLAGLSSLWVKPQPEIKHAVAADDTLAKLAAKYNTTIDSLRELNGLGKKDPLPSELRVVPMELTEAGKKAYAGLARNPALAESDVWITRSSFTGEDRPGKSGAGQYESPHHLYSPAERMLGLAGVLESTWMPEPVENNVAEQFYLPYIGPTIAVMHCLEPDISGVMISRDIENGARGDVTFQLVQGFGGGVEGGKTTEGVIHQGKLEVKITNGEEGGKEVDVMGTKVTDADMQKLRAIVLETEKYFNEVLEKDKGHAVDMEIARVNGEWMIVQARVILMDK
ncbi:MAG: LysM peptidoglycan-binding domain-containing protein [Deltaproteobacteria bacterium]|nr:LysM peptidoglycan-binding domain-containing protein [Deltaproteobacteria bacterium]